MNVRADGTVGLTYPSVAHSYQGSNIALHAAFAKERLELIHVTKLKIIGNSPTNLRIELVDTALETQDGSIVWQRNPMCIPLPIVDRNEVPFTFNGRAWTLVVYDHPPSEAEIDRFLSE